MFVQLDGQLIHFNISCNVACIDIPQICCRENALIEHLAGTFHVIFGDVNFTVSDRHCALVLATALQQRRRHDRIKDCLLNGADPQVIFPATHLAPQYSWPG